MAKKVAEMEAIINLHVDGDKEAINKIKGVENAVDAVENDGKIDLLFNVNEKGVISDVTNLKKKLENSGFKVQIDFDTDYFNKQFESLTGDKKKQATELKKVLQEAFNIDFDKTVSTGSLDSLNKQLEAQKKAYREQSKLIDELTAKKEKLREADLKKAFKDYKKSDSPENAGKFMGAYESYSDSTKDTNIKFKHNKRDVTYEQLTNIYNSILDNEEFDIDNLDSISDKIKTKQDSNFKNIESQIKKAQELKAQIEQETKALEAQIKNYSDKEQTGTKTSENKDKTSDVKTTSSSDKTQTGQSTPTEVKIIPDLSEVYEQLTIVKNTPLDITVDIYNKQTLFDEFKSKTLEVNVEPKIDPNFKLKVNAEIENISQNDESVDDVYKNKLSQANQYKHTNLYKSSFKEILSKFQNQSEYNEKDVAELIAVNTSMKKKTGKSLNIKGYSEQLGLDWDKLLTKINEVGAKLKQTRSESVTVSDKVSQELKDVPLSVIPNLTELYNQLTTVQNTPLELNVLPVFDETSINDLRSNLASIEQPFNSMGGSIDTQKANIDSLTTSVSELAAELKNIELDKLQSASKVSSKQTKKTDKEQQELDNIANVQKIKSQQNDFLKAIKANDNLDLKSLSVKETDGFAKLNIQINEVDGTVTRVKANLKDLSSVMTDGAIDVDKLKDASERLTTSLKTLKIDNSFIKKMSDVISSSGLEKDFKIEESDNLANEIKNKYDSAIASLKLKRENALAGNVFDSEEQFNQEKKEINDLIKKINELSESYKQLNKQGQYIGSLKGFTDDKDLSNQLRDLLKSRGNQSVQDLKLTHDAFGNLNGANATVVSDGQLKKVALAFQQYTNAAGNAEVQIRSLTKAEKEYESAGSKWITGLKNKFLSLTQYITGIEVVQRLWQQIKEGFTFVQELNSSLTTINQTMSASATALDNIGKSSIQTGKNLGTSAQDVLNAVAIYANANETASSILEKAQPTIMLANASGVDTETSADQIQGVDFTAHLHSNM